VILLNVAAAYIRVSTDDQLEYSPDSQLKLINDYARAHDLLLLTGYIYRENDGVSGRKAEKRPQFQKMIAAAKSAAHPFDTILVWKFSRFARNQEESIVYKSLLKKQCGIDVISVSEPIIDGPFGSLIERIIEWMDEYYSIRLSGEVRRGMMEKFSRGEVVTSAPFGYTVSDGIFVPDPERASIVKGIFEDFLAGTGYVEIAQRLNAMGIRSRRGKPFENRTVRYILRNEVYAGMVRFSGSGKHDYNYNGTPENALVKGKHEALISLEMYEAVQQRIAGLVSAYPPKAKTAQPGSKNMFRGIARCSSCGGVLIQTYSSGTHPGLQCRNYVGGVCKESHSITLERFTEAFLQKLEEDFSNEHIDILIDSPETKKDTEKIEAAIRRENARLERVAEAFQAGADTLEEYKKYKAEIRERIDQLRAELEEITAADEKHTPAEFIQKWRDAPALLRSPELSAEEKNGFIRQFIRKITFDRKANMLNIFYHA